MFHKVWRERQEWLSCVSWTGTALDVHHPAARPEKNRSGVHFQVLLCCNAVRELVGASNQNSDSNVQ